MAKLGMIVRMDNTGLGNQTKALCYMLKPDLVMVVNSSVFNGSPQHPEWYKDFNTIFTEGWPSEAECNQFMYGLTHMVTAETVYNNHIFWLAKKHKTKVFIQPNWEFLDHLKRVIPQPHKWLMPSYWHLEDMKAKFPNTIYLPPPLFLDNFADARNENIKTSSERHLLHIVGKAASHDRNGTKDLLEALKHSTADFKLTIRTQFTLEGYAGLESDPRVTVNTENLENEADMYKGFDALIFPRRYAGLCLPMNEALASALPVIMPDISPNNKVLPQNWLVPARVTDTFIGRTPIDVYSTFQNDLGKKIDEFVLMSDYDLLTQKLLAYEIAQKEYSHETLHEKYKKALEL